MPCGKAPSTRLSLGLAAGCGLRPPTSFRPWPTRRVPGRPLSSTWPCCGWLADRPAAVAAWRQFATATDPPRSAVPLEDAVEAEATAQLLDREAVELVDVVRQSFAIREFDTLLTRFAGHRQALRVPVDLTSLAGENEPPPKGYYSLLDRPRPEAGGGLTADTIPSLLGQVLIFGKQTDRDARLDLVASRSDLAARPASAGGSRWRRAGRCAERIRGRPDQRRSPRRWRSNGICPTKRRRLGAAG